MCPPPRPSQKGHLPVTICILTWCSIITTRLYFLRRGGGWQRTRRDRRTNKFYIQVVEPEPEKNPEVILEDVESNFYKLGDLGIFLLKPFLTEN